MAKLVTPFGVQTRLCHLPCVEILPTEARFAVPPFSRPAMRDGKEVYSAPALSRRAKNHSVFYNLFIIIMYHTYTCLCYFFGGAFAASTLAERGIEEVESFAQWFLTGDLQGKARGMDVDGWDYNPAECETPPWLPKVHHRAVAEPEDAFPAPHLRLRGGGWHDFGRCKADVRPTASAAHL